MGPRPRKPSGPAVMTAQTGRTQDCTPTKHAKPSQIPCNAGAIHTRRSAYDVVDGSPSDLRSWVEREGEGRMGTITTIGLDIAKSVFQVHGIDAAGEVVVRRRLSRGRVLAFFEKLPRCLVGMEACNTSHYWARELIALGHDVRLMPAQYVKPYVNRSKNDAADADAICEAVARPTMRFVAVKTPAQQSIMMLHRVRLMLNRQRTQPSNAMRAHMWEFGVVGPVGRMV